METILLIANSPVTSFVDEGEKYFNHKRNINNKMKVKRQPITDDCCIN